MTKRKMTKTQAVAKLVETRKLSTDLLEPLGIPFEAFLRFAQIPEETRDQIMSDLVDYYAGDDEEKDRIVAEAKAEIARKE